MCIKKFDEMTRGEKKCCACTITFAICFCTSISLIIGGFFVPPMGVIDGSVLTAVGELIFFPALLYGFRAVELGYEIKVKHGDTSLEVHKDEEL